VRLFADELATKVVRDGVDLAIQLPLVCDLANEFLRSIPLPHPAADDVDEMLALLLRNTSTSLRVEVAERLAHLDEGPRRTVRVLAHDSTPAVAVPVLRYSPLLSESELAAIARLRATPGAVEDHLIAIASRRDIGPEVTNVLTGRGSRPVLERLVQNDTARFSLLGLCLLAMRAYRDCPERKKGHLTERGRI
jgi:uncharacterized protein (DUF2336 family)